MKIIGHIKTDFISKFGLPRQGGLIEELKGKITFEPEYRQKEAFRGLEEYSHIWILWKFSESKRENWAATVTPPRLGGKERVGVFATRSPFRPNDIGMSVVKLDKIDTDSEGGPYLYVSGIDMVNDTPIYDIKPYIPYADSKPEAIGGFTESTKNISIGVDFPEELLNIIDEDKRIAALKILEQDPRPAFDTDPDRAYGIRFAEYDIRFRLNKDKLKVFEVLIVEDSKEFKKVK